MNHPLVKRIAGIYFPVAEAIEAWAGPLFLLMVRLVWGFQFMQTGWGKLNNHAAVAQWFGEDLQIPFPELNAWMAAGTELGGGALLFLGLGGRLASVPLIFTMVVAYATSDLDAVKSLTLTEWDDFLEAAPFLFLFASTIVLVYGSGPLSVDGLIHRAWKRTTAGTAGVGS